MDIDSLRAFCLSLPHTAEKVQWEDHLVFGIAGKMYAVAALEPGGNWLSLKCSQEEFAELIERPGVIPAPYLARAHWIALETSEALSADELQRLLRQAHALVFARLPKKTQLHLAQRPSRKRLAGTVRPRAKAAARRSRRRRQARPRSESK
jgi:predicted DNA-binding protein (MmcQ/YjbR family)